MVDTDEQASTLLRLLREEHNGGRVTCLPLNKLHTEPVQYPNHFGDQALPLTKYLKYPPAVRAAVDMVGLHCNSCIHIANCSSCPLSLKVRDPDVRDTRCDKGLVSALHHGVQSLALNREETFEKAFCANACITQVK